jgi:MFS family permease
VLFVDTVTFIISALLIGIGVPGAANRAAQPEIEGGRSYLAELAEGLRSIRAHAVLLSMILIATLGNFLEKPLMTVIPAGLLQDYLRQPTSLGLALGAFGAGALAGSLLFGATGRGWPRRVTFLACWVLGPLVIFEPSPHAAAVGRGARRVHRGVAVRADQPHSSMVIQEHIPPQMLGRVFRALTALAQAGIPIGAVLAGVVVQRAGLVPPSSAWAPSTCWWP